MATRSISFGIFELMKLDKKDYSNDDPRKEILSDLGVLRSEVVAESVERCEIARLPRPSGKVGTEIVLLAWAQIGTDSPARVKARLTVRERVRGCRMLKHVQLSPYRTRSADTFSLSSNTSYSSLSPEPLSSRSSSYSSLSDASPSLFFYEKPYVDKTSLTSDRDTQPLQEMYGRKPYQTMATVWELVQARVPRRIAFGVRVTPAPASLSHGYNETLLASSLIFTPPKDFPSNRLSNCTVPKDLVSMIPSENLIHLDHINLSSLM
ncbi:hypothetical protein J6590_071200 [Homalodisca vitripennis]|nr:hypothetical protein J6590_071200 [Homalodisca vitripennis]